MADKVFVVLKFAVVFTAVINGFKEASKQIYNSFITPVRVNWLPAAISQTQNCAPGQAECKGAAATALPGEQDLLLGEVGTGALGRALWECCWEPEGSHGCFVARQQLSGQGAAGPSQSTGHDILWD